MKERFRFGFKIFFIGAVLFFSYLMFSISLPYFAMDKHADIAFLKQKLNVYHIDYWRQGFYIHVFTSVLVLIAGATQFSSGLIRNYPKIHRYMGWMYIVVVLLFSGPGAFVMSMHANGGAPAKVSFVFLTTLWMIFTFLAFWYVYRKKDFMTHGEFMLRSYALTFSAITLRLYLIIINHYHFDLKPTDKYIIVAWLSWVPNLIIAEILIRRGFISGFLKRKNKIS